ncbi:TPA: UDP-N-acetylmuramoyl-tripeptide--D-alanyl-D-alanine ligase [bacterium]|nr:UDP-N-acetylmuramoyl-tripeptide--D-alanyl-D-alanine ligase [bacterium]
MITNVLLLIALLLWLRRFIFQTTYFIHILQLEGYRNGRFISWLIKNPKKIFDEECLISSVVILFIGLFLESFGIELVFFLILWIFVGIWLFRRCKRLPYKKPLVWTGRIKRLFGLSIILPCFLLGFIFYSSPLMLLFFFISQIIIQTASIFLVLANTFLYPLESAINYYFFLCARKKIRRIGPKVIGIAGSYGKTSTKFIIFDILSKKYKTITTPESYNTLMGICKVINNELKKEHEIFVVEMGAYKRGDIKELCNLVRPQIGVLTSIGPEHFERFGSMEKIISTEFELIEALPKDGIAFVNTDDEILLGLMDRIKIEKHSYSIKDCEEIDIDKDGIKFKIKGEIYNTKLLGLNNLKNILAGITVGLELGVDIEKIKDAVSSLDFIPHRLQLIKNPNNVFVLDDSYNSNPVGADCALNVLSLFSKRRKIIVTPGMIELGKKEYEENKEFGKKIGKTCDIVFLVGRKRTKPIFDGLKSVDFPQNKIFITNSLNEARIRLERIVRSNDIILFENDLPDNYDEDFLSILQTNYWVHIWFPSRWDKNISL